MTLCDRDWYREEYKKKEHLLEQGYAPRATFVAAAAPVPPRPNAPAPIHIPSWVKIAGIALGSGVISYLVVSVILDYL